MQTFEEVLPGVLLKERFFSVFGFSVKSPKEHIEMDLRASQMKRLSK